MQNLVSVKYRRENTASSRACYGTQTNQQDLVDHFLTSSTSSTSKMSLACFLLSSIRSTLVFMSILGFLALCSVVFTELTLRFLAGAMIAMMLHSRDKGRIGK